jgi:hypothetical protein
LNNYRAFHLDPCGVTRLNHDGRDRWEVTSINNQPYTVETRLAR